MKNTFKVLSFMWLALKKYRIALFAMFILFGFAVAIGDAIVPIYIKNLTNTLQEGNISGAGSIMYMLLGLYFVMRIFIFVSIRLLSWFQARTARDLHTLSYDYFTNHSYHFYKDQFTGSLVSKATRLGENMIRVIDNIVFNFFALGITIISILIVLFSESTVIGLMFFAFLLVYFSFIYFMSRKLSPMFEERSRLKSAFTGTISDIITNIQTILFFGNSHIDKDLYEESNTRFFKSRYKAWVTATNYQELIGFTPHLFTVGVTFYAIHLVTIGVFSVGSVILVFLLGNNLNGQMWRIGGAMKRMVSDISDTIEAIEIIEAPITVKDINKPISFVVNEGSVHFKNISFTYPEGEHVFNNFELCIPSGQSIGVVGKSGSGKSTLTKLLLRLYDLDKGVLLIDNQDISQAVQNNVRRSIAYIPQETILFHRTILENIAYGSPSATQEEIMEAAQFAYVDEFVQNLEDKYETKVGERGIKLSGGQRQRIGIARAMLKKNAAILVMDEATSSLDSMSEKYIQDSFEKLSKDRTTIVIAHRLSTIQKMDRIIVMEKGRIIEDGSHSKLLEQNGHYAELWNSQVDGFIPEN